MMLYMCTKFQIFHRVSVIELMLFVNLKFAKGHNSVKCRWSYGPFSIHIV